jgi:hypothetical protein
VTTPTAYVADNWPVTREQAIERVRKLRAVTVERGATEAEAAVAASRAARLVARFGLQSPPAPEPAPAPAWAHAYAAAGRRDRRSARSLRFVGFA